MIGIRPGEKMHEIMVSEEEAQHCSARRLLRHLPMLPELWGEQPATPMCFNGRIFLRWRCFSIMQGTIGLFKKNMLMVGQLR